MPVTLDDLRRARQGIWLDSNPRSLIRDGALERHVESGWVSGVLSNPARFADDLAHSDGYAGTLRDLASGDTAEGTISPESAYERLAIENARRAADALLPVYERTAARDGYVTVALPYPPGADRAVIERAARRRAALLARPNVMLNVPGSGRGVDAAEALLADGINVNVAPVSDWALYELVARAYLSALDRRVRRGEPVDRVASVATVSLAPIDAAAGLRADSPLAGAVALAAARQCYRRFRVIFQGPQWGRLATAGARPQRLLWSALVPESDALPALHYVDGLVTYRTVLALPRATLAAFADHGSVDPRAVEGAIDDLDDTLDRIRDAGLDLLAVLKRLRRDSAAAAATQHEQTLQSIAKTLPA